VPSIWTYVEVIRAAAVGRSWDWTAIGTVALAVVTFATLGYTIFSTRYDRRAADNRAAHDREAAMQREARDRADAEQRLREERYVSEQRIRDERAVAAEVQRRDAQRTSAIELIRRVAALQPLMNSVPALAQREQASSARRKLAELPVSPHEFRDLECRAAIESLRLGAWTEAAMLGTGDAAVTAADRYRQLVRLVDEAALTTPHRDRDVDALLNFATWVRITLRMLADDEIIPSIYGGAAETPVLGSGDSMPAWTPSPLPPEWVDEVSVNAPLRRSATVQIGTRTSQTEASNKSVESETPE
jgi:hypothetical protein